MQKPGSSKAEATRQACEYVYGSDCAEDLEALIAEVKTLRIAIRTLADEACMNQDEIEEHISDARIYLEDGGE